MDDLLRQGSVGAPAVRSMLLTMLGEYVAPANRSFFRDGAIAALESIGYGTHAARQALARSVEGGWLVSERVGRRSRMRLTDDTRQVLRAGYPRIYGFGEPWTWDGRWHLLVMRVREEHRGVRDRLRSQLAWNGFGSLGGGVWISPHAERGQAFLDSLDAEAGTLSSFTAGLDRPQDPRTVIAQAWDLEAIGARYGEFARDFGELEPNTPEEVFRAQVALVHAWRKFPFVDPDLPQELLPADWPRPAALALFQARHARWAGPAEDFFRSVAD